MRRPDVEGTGIEADNPQSGGYEFKMGSPSRFANYMPPVLGSLGPAKAEHNVPNNRMRAL